METKSALFRRLVVGLALLSAGCGAGGQGGLAEQPYAPSPVNSDRNGDLAIPSGMSPRAEPQFDARRAFKSPLEDGRWVPVPAMSVPREFHAAVKLEDGRVLVTGGDSDGGAVSSAEVFDPATWEWAPVAPMRRPRTGHAAILLPSGEVLVAGGAVRCHCEYVYSPVLDVEVYDPSQNVWRDVGDLPRAALEPRAFISAGDVILASRQADLLDSRSPRLPVFRFDVRGERWAEFEQAGPHRPGLDVVMPRDDRLLWVGGLKGTSGSSDVTQLRLDSGESADFASLLAPRARPHAVLIDDRTLLVVGGTFSERDSPTSEWVDVSSRLALPLVGPSQDRTNAVPVRLITGDALFVGGSNLDGADEQAELFEQVTGRWWMTPPLRVSRAGGHSVTALDDGGALVAGGYSGDGVPTAEAELWVSGGPSNSPPR